MQNKINRFFFFFILELFKEMVTLYTRHCNSEEWKREEGKENLIT